MDVVPYQMLLMWFILFSSLLHAMTCYFGCAMIIQSSWVFFELDYLVVIQAQYERIFVLAVICNPIVMDDS